MATATAARPFTFDEPTHTYWEDSLLRPSVTQVLRAEGFLDWLDKIPRHILEHKRQLGKLVHQATALLDQGEDLNNFDIPPEVVPYLSWWENFKLDSGFVPELIEHCMIGDVYGMRYGMTPDRRGPINGVRHIAEIKCGATEDPVWGLQLAAYDLGLIPVDERPRDPRVAVQLGSQFPRGYKLHPYEDPTDYTIWTNSLANTIWKQNKNLCVIEEIPERLIA